MDHLSTVKRLWINLYRRMNGEDATPEYIARGWAIGMFCGFMIPFGLQLLCSIPAALLMRGSKLGATLGTFATNHFTIFFIYPLQCWLGNLCVGGDLSYAAIAGAMEKVIEKQDYETLMALGGELVLSFFIGGAIFAAVTTPVTYYAVRDIVFKYRARRLARAGRTRRVK